MEVLMSEPKEHGGARFVLHTVQIQEKDVPSSLALRLAVFENVAKREADDLGFVTPGVIVDRLFDEMAKHVVGDAWNDGDRVSIYWAGSSGHYFHGTFQHAEARVRGALEGLVKSGAMVKFGKNDREPTRDGRGASHRWVTYATPEYVADVRAEASRTQFRLSDLASAKGAVIDRLGLGDLLEVSERGEVKFVGKDLFELVERFDRLGVEASA